MNTITFASHVAYLDPMTGGGLLVRPKPADDLSLSMVSLHRPPRPPRRSRRHQRNANGLGLTRVVVLTAEASDGSVLVGCGRRRVRRGGCAGGSGRASR
jgi:hypothetical protein